MPSTTPFPRYPRLRRSVKTERWGRVTLHEVTETSDGYLTGWATVFDGTKDAYQHSIFLGKAASFR